MMFLQKHALQAIEEGVCHMWTVSAFQQHPNTMIIVDEVATFSDRAQVSIILTAWEHHILIVLVQFQHECIRTQPLSCECGQ